MKPDNLAATTRSNEHSHRRATSVHAMLHGYGDRREKRFQRFERNYLKSHPDASDPAVLEAYAIRCRLPVGQRIYQSSCETIGIVATNLIMLLFSALVAIPFLPDNL